MAQTSGNEYSVQITGDGITIERHVSSEVARRLINIIMGAQEVDQADADDTTKARDESTGHYPSQNAKGRRISLREFLDQYSAGNNPEKVVAIGEYIESVESKNDFTREDIKTRFRSAGEPAPANFPRDFANALKYGWVAEDIQASGRYYVTQSGRDAMLSGFPASAKKSTVRKTRKKTKANQNRHDESGE
jgi:hypothetical protein